MTTATLSPALTIVNGTPVVSSLDVADHFGKRHDHLTRTIRSLHRNSLEILDAPIFGDVEYVDSKGEKRVAHWMTEEGFSLLVMGFTGRKALLWKLAYIKAFKMMRDEFTGRALPTSDEPNAIPSRLTTGAERKPLAIAVNKVIGVNDEGPTRQKYMCFWRTLNAALGINHIDELTVDRLPAVRALLELLVNLVVSPTGGNVLATMPPNVEGLSHREQVFALQDWFDRSQKQFVDVAYTVERKILGLAKDADMSGIPAMERMHVKNMREDTAHAFRDGMFSLQTVSNAVRPLFRVLASAVSMGGSKTTRPALPR